MISVVVASYRRPERLELCLDGVRRQSLPPAEVIVVVHDSDAITAGYVQRRMTDWPELRCVHAELPGSVAAYNAGLSAAREPLVAYIDDDALPSRAWLEQIAALFGADHRIAAVGGRDLIPEGFGRGGRGRVRVGEIQWFGRMIANHHLGRGVARDVDVLKGVNMAFRRSEVVEHGFDGRLLGAGAQVHAELTICLPLRRRGLRVVYDPRIVVMHSPAPRPAGDHRHVFDAERVSAAAHNEALAVLDYLSPVRRRVYRAWALAIGTSDAPGLAVALRDALRRRPAAWRRLLAAQRGRLEASQTRRRPRAVLATAAIASDRRSRV